MFISGRMDIVEIFKNAQGILMNFYLYIKVNKA